MPESARSCGRCSLCCQVLRVDALAKPGGTPCRHQRAEGGCGIYAERPGICRAYRCAWLQGSFEDDDRPDRLGAVLDFSPRVDGLELCIRQASADAFDTSPRLQEIANRYRETLPVRITHAEDVWNASRPYRILRAKGAEERVSGERVETFQDGERVSERRIPWLERSVRRAWLALQRRRLRRLTPPPHND
ncbi:MAG: hypothetical protein MJE66_14290 [Proteobacteria bacterium]|nr:hypothetical protein [Pseudomonadota bacterium]